MNGQSVFVVGYIGGRPYRGNTMKYQKTSFTGKKEDSLMPTFLNETFPMAICRLLIQSNDGAPKSCCRYNFVVETNAPLQRPSPLLFLYCSHADILLLWWMFLDLDRVDIIVACVFLFCMVMHCWVVIILVVVVKAQGESQRLALFGKFGLLVKQNENLKINKNK